jgi:plasmid stabilization system protein ParE
MIRPSRKTWRTEWRSLVRQPHGVQGREEAKGAIESGNGWSVVIAALRRAAAPFRGLRFHDLRYLGATKLAESEASDATIQETAT